MNQPALNLQPPLEFIRAGRWYKESRCKRYTVSKSYVKGVQSYSAWRRRGREHQYIPIHLGERPTPEEAEALCRADDATLSLSSASGLSQP